MNFRLLVCGPKLLHTVVISEIISVSYFLQTLIIHVELTKTLQPLVKMAEKLCREYQKLVIPSTGQNKMQVGGLASLCMEKNCKTKSGKLTNANSIKRLIPLGQRKEHKCTPCPPSRPFSTWAANCYIHPKSLSQTDVLVQLLG